MHRATPAFATPIATGTIAFHPRPAAARRMWAVAERARVRLLGAATPWVRPALLGLLSGGLVALGSGAVLLVYLSGAAAALPAEARGFVRDYSVGLAAEAMAVCAAVGILAGLAARFAAGAGEVRRVALALAGLWAGITAACIYFSPTSLPDVALISRMPFAVPLGCLAAGAAVAGRAARVRWPRYLAAQCLLAAPLLAPDPRPGSPVAPVAPPGATGSVLLLGLDNVGRDGMQQLAARLQARAGTAGRDAGIRYIADAVSPVPVTRLAWTSLLLGRDPGTLFGVDTMSSAQRRAYFDAQPFLLTRETARAGYASSYTTDDATSNYFLPGEVFDTLHADALGWQVTAAATIATAFPLAQGYLGRWRGDGVIYAPGGTGTWRVFRRAARELALTDGRPRLVAAHAVSLHGILRPNAREVGGLTALLRRTPADLQSEDLLSPMRGGSVLARENVLWQDSLYGRRRTDVLQQTEDFIAELTRAGHREHTLIVLFTDHGEFFYPRSRRNLPGLHGVELDPASVAVGAIVLLPTSGGGLDEVREPAADPRGVTTVRGPFALQQLGEIVAEFAARRGGVAPPVLPTAAAGTRPHGGWLAGLARGDTLAARTLPARSAGRPPLGDSALTNGRRTLSDAEHRDAIRLWPDGRVTFTARARELVDVTSDVGWTDGRWLLTYSELSTGEHRAHCYRDGSLVGQWLSPSPPQHPYGGVAGSVLRAAAGVAIPAQCAAQARLARSSVPGDAAAND